MPKPNRFAEYFKKNLSASDERFVEKYSPDQERDESGRFTSGGGDLGFGPIPKETINGLNSLRDELRARRNAKDGTPKQGGGVPSKLAQAQEASYGFKSEGINYDRKPTDVSAVFSTVRASRVAGLAEFKAKEIGVNPHAFMEKVDALPKGMPQHFVMDTPASGKFLVNTEGYGYPRYVSRVVADSRSTGGPSDADYRLYPGIEG